MLRSLISFNAKSLKALVGLAFLVGLLLGSFQLALAANSSLINQKPLEESQVIKHIENALNLNTQALQQDAINQVLEDASKASQLNFSQLPKQQINVDALPKLDSLTDAKIKQDLAKLLKDIDKPGNEADLGHHLANQPQANQGPLILVSFSMPDELIKSLGQAVHQAGGGLLFKGLIEDSFETTFKRITELADGAEIPMALDPITFARFEAEQVPTFVVAHGLETCQVDQPCTQLKYSKLTGAVTLDYALNTIKNASKHEEVRSLASQFLATYEGVANE